MTEVLAEAGALFADRLAYKDTWCLLLHKGRGVIHEALVTSRPGHNYTQHDVSPLTTRVTVPRTSGEAGRCGSLHDSHVTRRGGTVPRHNRFIQEVPGKLKETGGHRLRGTAPSH